RERISVALRVIPKEFAADPRNLLTGSRGHGPGAGHRFTKTRARALRTRPRGLERSAAATNRWRDDRWALRASLSAEKARAMMGSSHRAPSTTRPVEELNVKRYSLTHLSNPV